MKDFLKKFDFKHLAAPVALVIFVLIAIGLLDSSVTSDGVAVPTELDSLVEASQSEGFQVPSNVEASCFPKDQVTDDTITEITSVLGKVNSCQFQDDAWDGDALWGAIALAVLLGLLLVGHKAYEKYPKVAFGVFAASVVGALLLGSWLDDRFDQWLTDNDVVGEIFWRGFFAAGAALVGVIIAHEINRKQACPDPSVH